ncbi:hypothetical protein [Stackebrandtia nassauensis]|uniref:hypothetical protein n=1 Tax=Stackebrandtia nassauensis TaxID=283811 RepID=UPI001185284A|nr:hypothetical protein [Stackebrandtia nassauensis]
MSEDRGPLGVRWLLDDARYSGSTEVWVEAVASDACVLHTFVRVDRRGGSVSAWRRRRVRDRMVKTLWRFKDDVEGRVAHSGG